MQIRLMSGITHLLDIFGGRKLSTNGANLRLLTQDRQDRFVDQYQTYEVRIVILDCKL